MQVQSRLQVLLPRHLSAALGSPFDDLALCHAASRPATTSARRPPGYWPPCLNGVASGFDAAVAPLRSFGAWNTLCFFGADAAVVGAGAAESGAADWADEIERPAQSRAAMMIDLVTSESISV
jgi:hypothetical protein